MDPRLLRYYDTELQHLREVGAEFAREYPKIAGRLGLEGLECSDPYVERILEGVALLTARVQLRLDEEFPKFTHHLLESVYPHYLAPLPSMCVVQFQPDFAEGALAGGFTIARQTTLRSLVGRGDSTACEYRTATNLTLWPLELVEAEYLPRDHPAAAVLNCPREVKSVLRLRLQTAGGFDFRDLALQSLRLYLQGTGTIAMQLYEQLLGHTVGMIVRPSGPAAGDRTLRKPSWEHRIAHSPVSRVGYSPEESLFPQVPQAFQGYRLLQEYFSLPQRFMFVDIGQLSPAISRSEERALEIFLLFDVRGWNLEQNVDVGDFGLHCVPAVNIFRRRGDRIHLDQRHHEYPIVPDRTKPLDLEVFQVTSVTGYGSQLEEEQSFLPLYSLDDLHQPDRNTGYYVTRRLPRAASETARRRGPRASYIGSDVSITIVDRNSVPHHPDLEQLGVELLCTNRDLPLQMPIGTGTTDFTLEINAPAKSIRCVAGPTPPKPSPALLQGESAWRLINHLSLNYLSLCDDDIQQSQGNGQLDHHRGATALRQLLTLYADNHSPVAMRQIEGLQAVRSRPIVRTPPGGGPVAVVRGLEVSVTFDEAAFEGSGAFLLGAVLAEFFRRYVTVNSFTETVVETLERGEVMRWPVTWGRHARL